MYSDDDERRRRNADIKTLRMCRQVEEALGLALAGSCGDELLQNLEVESVGPGADGSTLIVTIRVPEGENPVAALAKLEMVRGILRSEIAAAISRKKVPQMLFRLSLHKGVPNGQEGPLKGKSEDSP